LVALVLATGCGTIVNGRFQKVPVVSEPAGAAIAVACGDSPSDGGVTPATITLRRGVKSCSITLKKSGYAEQTIAFEREITGAFWANFSCGFAGAVIAGASKASSGDSGAAADAVSNVPAIAGSIGVCMGIDYLTGSHYGFAPKSVNVALKR
jgi:hypothetical protein